MASEFSEVLVGTVLSDSSNQPKYPPSLFVDYHGCQHWELWQERILEHKPEYAFTFPLSSPYEFERAGVYIHEAHYRCNKEVVVVVDQEDTIEPVREAGYTIGVLADHDQPAPWLLAPHRVWVIGGRPMQLWRRFCELAFTGCDVRGVILGLDWYERAAQGFVTGRTPYKSHYIQIASPGVAQQRERLRRASLKAQVEFWDAVRRVYR